MFFVKLMHRFSSITGFSQHIKEECCNKWIGIWIGRDRMITKPKISFPHQELVQVEWAWKQIDVKFLKFKVFLESYISKNSAFFINLFLFEWTLTLPFWWRTFISFIFLCKCILFSNKIIKVLIMVLVLDFFWEPDFIAKDIPEKLNIIC